MSGFVKKAPSELALKRMREKALRTLRFDRFDKPTEEEILERFRNMVKQSHPDSAEGEVIEVDLTELRQCKDYLINAIKEENNG